MTGLPMHSDIILRRFTGGKEKRSHLHFNASRPDEYKSRLRDYLDGEFNLLKPTTFHEWHQTVNEVQDLICAAYQLLLDKILKAVHQQTHLPATNTCYCDNDLCRVALFSKTIYSEELPLWDVHFTDNCIMHVLNLAHLNDDITSDIVRYFVRCVKKHFDDFYRISRCCPISLLFIREVELIVNCTKAVCFECLQKFNSSDSCIDIV